MSDWRKGKFFITKNYDCVIYHGCMNNQHALIGKCESYLEALEYIRDYNIKNRWIFTESRVIDGIRYYEYKPNF